MRGRIPRGVWLVLAACALVVLPPTTASAGGGLNGKYSGKIKEGYSHKFFNIRERERNFAGGTLRYHIGVDFHGTKMVGMFDATLNYGNRGSCGEFAYFRAKRHS